MSKVHLSNTDKIDLSRVKKLRLASYFAIQHDESTDVSNCAILLCFVLLCEERKCGRKTFMLY